MATDVHEGSIKTKILIIGAGIAGISAAEYLTKNGFTEFKIVESSNRIGGRIWTHDIGIVLQLSVAKICPNIVNFSF